MQTAMRIGAALLAGLAIGGNAMSDVITVLDPLQRIITNNDWQIGIFEGEFTIRPYFDGMPAHLQLENSLRLGFSELPLQCSIVANDLPLFPPEPFQTPSLYGTGGLAIENWIIDYSAPPFWVDPAYDGDNGAVDPAVIFQGTAGGDFNVDAFEEGESAFIAYSTSNHSMFGYMQLQRGSSRTEWHLIGYAFDPTGAPITVKPLPVGPVSLLSLGGASLAGRRARRT